MSVSRAQLQLEHKSIAMSRLCFPYGAGIECTCDGRTKRILRCVSILASSAQGKEPPPISDSYYEDPDVLASEEDVGSRGGDERTEIILAATFLLMVVLSFVGFLVYRCEQSFLRPSYNMDSCSRHTTEINSIAVQTVPVMAAENHHYNGEILTVTRTMNGGPPPLQGHGEPMIEIGQQHIQQQQQQQQQQQLQHEQQQQQLGLSQAASWVDEPHAAEIRTISRALTIGQFSPSPSDCLPGDPQHSSSPLTGPQYMKECQDPQKFRLHLEEMMLARQEAERVECDKELEH